MKIKIYRSNYKDQSAINIESNLIKAQFLTHIGSKMCSFIYKPINLDLLVHRNSKKYKIEKYDGNYLDGECSGFDEMFPSVSECYYESFPWQGIRIPDHGELWSVPWEYEVKDDKLIMAVYGIRFPYRMKKTIHFIEDNILSIRYELINLSNFNFEFIWAAHPMFIVEEGSEILLPDEVEKVLTSFSYSGRIGKYGDEHNWPSFKSKKGKEERLNVVRSDSVKDTEKYFIKGKMPKGWCALKYNKSNIILILSFPNNIVSYLSVLPNEGGWNNLYNIFIEPCTSSFDRLDVAKLRNEYCSVKPRSKINWYLNLTISEVIEFKKVSSKGYLI